MKLEDRRAAARQLVGTLDTSETQILECLVKGMSAKAIAAALQVDADEASRLRTSLFRKLGARTTADAVRIGLYALDDPPG